MGEDKRAPEPWPTQLRLLDEGRRLAITFDSGETFTLESGELRKKTPSAEARRLSDAEREALVGARGVRIVTLEPVGNYAVRPTFDDGHSTGIFSWTYLAELGRAAKPK